MLAALTQDGALRLRRFRSRPRLHPIARQSGRPIAQTVTVGNFEGRANLAGCRPPSGTLASWLPAVRMCCGRISKTKGSWPEYRVDEEMLSQELACVDFRWL